MRFVGVSLDCPDPDDLGRFYQTLLGGQALWRSDDSVGVQTPEVLLVMQRVRDYHPPRWPGTAIVHLDLAAGDVLADPESLAHGLGARLAGSQPDPRWRVLLDPAGHPFCITTVTPPAT